MRKPSPAAEGAPPPAKKPDLLRDNELIYGRLLTVDEPHLAAAKWSFPLLVWLGLFIAHAPDIGVRCRCPNPDPSLMRPLSLSRSLDRTRFSLGVSSPVVGREGSSIPCHPPPGHRGDLYAANF